MLVNGEEYKTVWMEKGNPSSVFMIDQRLLPGEFKIIELKNHYETCEAIKDMAVRGAGAIGVSAGYAMAQAFIESGNNRFPEIYIEKAKERIEATRPTAQNLFYATNHVYNAAMKSSNPREIAIQEAEKNADEDEDKCKNIGLNGNNLIKDGCTIMTHCNAGWPAFRNWGSALSPIYVAHREGKNVFVYVSETGPRVQGAITDWELEHENIPHTVIDDNAVAVYMPKVNMVIVGADRIARNGDTANKIGTYPKAIIAKYFNVPFYIAAPTTTFDLECVSGDNIPIEERSQHEVLTKTGITKDGRRETVRLYSVNATAKNPAFDVTPAELITGIITEKGIIKPTEEMIMQLFSV